MEDITISSPSLKGLQEKKTLQNSRDEYTIIADHEMFQIKYH